MEEDEGEIINERFLKMLTTEVEEIVEEAVREGRQEQEALLENAGRQLGIHRSSCRPGWWG